MPQLTPKLEVCVDSAAGLEAAIAGGADRIELCSALALGGLTPSLGLMELAPRAPVPVYALIRPRAGGFVYNPDEVTLMKADIAAARHAGLGGVVIGASRTDGTLDVAVLRDLKTSAGELDLTLHRAFDLTPDPIAALESAIGLGFSRILTSGGQTTALAGKPMLQKLVAGAQDRISIMPGSGINPETVHALLDGLAVRDIHASCATSVEENPQLVTFGFSPDQMRMTDARVVANLKMALRAYDR